MRVEEGPAHRGMEHRKAAGEHHPGVDNRRMRVRSEVIAFFLGGFNQRAIRSMRARLPAGRDYTAWAVALFATVLSVAAYLVTHRAGGVLLYPDAKSHLEIARRVISSTSPGLAQLGNVWVPLPHLLMLPLIWSNALYHNGFAGSIVSMAAYVATAVLIYKTTLGLTARKIGGLTAAGVFALNVDLLYMQSTPMTESLLFCMIAATVYCVQRWAQSDKYQYLVAGGVAGFFATLTRYESWPIVACLLVAVVIIGWQRGYPLTPKLRWAGTRDRFIAFAVISLAGIVGWLVWNWAIFGDPLDFQNGAYAKPALWRSNDEPAIGHWAVAAKTYWYAMVENGTLPLLLLAAVGLVVFMAIEWRTRRGAGRSLPVLSLLVPAPFFVVALYTGQRPVHVPQINHDLYDVRFGLIMLLPAAIFNGYLVASLRRVRHAPYAMGSLVLALAVGLGGQLLEQHKVATYNEAAQWRSTVGAVNQQQVIRFLRAHYAGGQILMESFGNEELAFVVPSSQLVYEGSYHQWLPARQHPAASRIAWVIARCGSKPDRVCTSVTNAALSGYKLVYRTGDRSYQVYRIRS